MKRFFLPLIIAMLLIFTSGIAFAASLSLNVESLRFNADDRQDIMGTNSSQNPDGRTDASFNLDISGTSAIRDISLKNESTGRMWSSDPIGSTELLLVKDSNGSTLNQSGRLPLIPVLLGANFRLYISDAQASIPRDSTFIVTVKLIDNNEITGRTTVRSLGYNTHDSNPGYGEGIIDLVSNGITRSDYANNGERVGSDGRDDFHFDVKLRFNDAIIRSMKLTASSGSRSAEWDTFADNRVPILTVVDSNNRIVNKANGDVYFKVTGTETGSLLVQDNNRILSDSYAKVTLTVTLSDGRVYEKQAVIDNNNSSAGNNYSSDYITAEDRGTGRYDLVGNSERFESNLNADRNIDLTLNAEGTVKGIRVTDKKNGKIWDTLARNNYPLVAVTNENGKRLNKSDGTVWFSVNGTTKLSLWIDDKDYKKSGPYDVDLILSTGQIFSTSTKRSDNNNKSKVTKDDRDSRFTSAKPQMVNLDFVGKNKNRRGDGYKDTSLNIQVIGRGKITQMVLTNNEGKGVWDTISGKSTWLLGVLEDNKIQNKTNKEIDIKVNGTKTYQLLMQDNGTLLKKHGKLTLSITWGDNELTKSTINW